MRIRTHTHTLSPALSLCLSLALDLAVSLFSSLSLAFAYALSLVLSVSSVPSVSLAHPLSLARFPARPVFVVFFVLSVPLSLFSSLSRTHACYGVATISSLLKIISLFHRTQCLLQGSFTKETYNLKAPTHRSHPISCPLCLPPRSRAFAILFFPSLFFFPSHIEYAIFFWVMGYGPLQKSPR